MLRLFTILCVLFVAANAQQFGDDIDYQEFAPDLSFNEPTEIAHLPGDTSKFYVTMQSGLIKVVEMDDLSDSSTFLDLRDQCFSSNSETGLLGLAFHPDFSSNRLFYVYYNFGSNAEETRLSEFEADDANALTADIDTERVLLQIDQPASNHNGGKIQFGSDGLLYLGVGDGGGGGDPYDAGQDASDLLGTILRIDVDNTDPGREYAIPASNPFANGQGGAPEVFAFGLRNPWRFDIDADGNIWIGDVGQNELEEISVVTSPGQNLGWSIMEACECFSPSSNCDESGLRQPITQYDHTLGQSVTGGVVYTGNNPQVLNGQYIYADYSTGRFFAISAGNPSSTGCNVEGQELFQDNGLSPTAFAQFGNDLLFASQDNGGTIYRIIDIEQSGTPAPPPSTPSSPPPPTTPPPPAGNSAPSPPSSYDHTYQDDKVKIEWETEDNEWLHVRVTAETEGWLAVGYSDDGSMNSNTNGADIAMGWVESDGTEQLFDYFAKSTSRPDLDEQQNLENMDVSYDDDDLVIRFTRALNTGDSFEDRVIPSSGEFFWIWAYSDVDPTAPDNFNKHSERGAVRVSLLAGVVDGSDDNGDDDGSDDNGDGDNGGDDGSDDNGDDDNNDDDQDSSGAHLLHVMWAVVCLVCLFWVN